MTQIGSYLVPVRIQGAEIEKAIIAPATVDDLPYDWTCNWPELWKKTDFDLQNIVKLVYNQQLWGLVKYGLYPYPGQPEILEIENLEANPISTGQQAKRLISPIGKWLIWYGVQVGLRNCSALVSNPLVVLIALDSAFDYYRDIIGMEYVGPMTIAPGEDGYAFKFNRENAVAFCTRQEREWGKATPFEC